MNDGLTPGATLRKRRRDLGLTQAELAERIGVPQPTISEWERGSMRIQHARLLFLALNAVADDLAAERTRPSAAPV